MSLLAAKKSQEPSREQYQDEEEFSSVDTNHDVKESVACYPDPLHPPIDEDTKVRLAIRTSEVMVPGAIAANNSNRSVGGNKQPPTTEMEFSYRQILKNRPGFGASEYEMSPSMQADEEELLDDMQERMTEFRDNHSSQIETENEDEKQRKRKRRTGVFLFVVCLLVIVAVILGVVFGIKAGTQKENKNSADQGQQEIDDLNAMRFEECLLDDNYVSSRFFELKQLLLDNVDPTAVLDEDELSTSGTSQRAALCWLSEVDGFIEKESLIVADVLLQVNQRFAFVSVYYQWIPFGSLQTNKLSTSNWLSEDHVCEWDFVSCNTTPDNRVTELILEGIGLDTFIPREVALLSDLVSLRLIDCDLTGNVPVELYGLTKLEILDLSFNLLSGQISSEIARLGKLRHVALFRNRLTGDIPADLFELPHMNYLSVIHNNLAGRLPVTLSNASSLTNLDIGFNILQGTIPDISRLTNLKVLVLQDTLIKDSFPNISPLTNLEEINFDGVSISGTIPSTPWFFPRLRKLSLERTELTGSIPVAIGLLTTLEYLSLRSTRFSGSIPADLGNLSRLSNLQLGGPRLLSGTFPTELGRLSKLWKLELPRESKISGTVPSEICNLLDTTRLQEIVGPCAPQCDCCNCK